MLLATGLGCTRRYLEFYRRHGYEELGEVALGPIREHVLFYPTRGREAMHVSARQAAL